jgi:hypothetical protein|tara:strand:- start:221 stop:358 length:138 start_codon:yes stop_codon:yes gene_type:complete
MCKTKVSRLYADENDDLHSGLSKVEEESLGASYLAGIYFKAEVRN